MGSIYGKIFQISTFGESHGAAVGVVVTGCPAGVDFDLDFIQSELGYNNLSIDKQEFLTSDGFAKIPYHRESRRMVKKGANKEKG